MLTVYFHIILASTKYCSFAAKTQLPLTVFTYIYVCTVAFATFFVPSVLSVIVGYYPSNEALDWSVRWVCHGAMMLTYQWRMPQETLHYLCKNKKSDWLWVLYVYNTRHFNISLYCLSLSYYLYKMKCFHFTLYFECLLANAKHAGILMLNKVKFKDIKMDITNVVLQQQFWWYECWMKTKSKHLSILNFKM